MSFIGSRRYLLEAVKKLNLLQSNKSAIEQIRKDIKLGQKCTNLEDMENYLHRTGVNLSMLDELSVIHVAGTKGKGSTSAMCESVLRHHGYRTGFYSSPHLVAVRERIRLNGCIVEKETFSKHFRDVYDRLHATQSFEGDMPKYFAFLTVLAYNMFLKEKVDVAIVEVGIGGVVDYTNVLRKVPVVGITALGLDHTSILGTTLPEIAEAKAGIMKTGCDAYTVQQPTDAMEVLEKVASNVKCSLHIVPDYKSYTFENGLKLKLPVEIEAYRMNASLAIQLAHAWMRKNKTHSLNNITNVTNGAIYEKVYKGNGIENNVITKLPNKTIKGLSACKWPGRYQVIETEYSTFYLDGAHTKESMEICANWFEDNNKYQDKSLIFSATGDRDAEVLLTPLKFINFKSVYFVIPTAFKEISHKNDNFSTMEYRDLIARCQKNEATWNRLQENDKCSKVTVLECVSDALSCIKQNGDSKSVLITGSLHLVGAALSIIDPNLSEN
ncbi:folylpolyglutamate synthase, mitochondrial isoform X2 [Papilio machaon]|uniref:folylpolyglutamate synthase, mitochondrial isoform X2 n=1 Tax=Papilio machaon TaxID=76193 RepID=UPI001E66511A|nr:folylpolyglutamate synthase, mitochondrial isoform X2 [Papilio machaon]